MKHVSSNACSNAAMLPSLIDYIPKLALKCQLVINTRAGGAMEYPRVASSQNEQIALLIQLCVYAILRDQGHSLQTVGHRRAELQFHDGRPRPAKTLHDAMNAEPRSAK